MTLYFVWGSTYLAIRYALECFPPLGMSGVRFLLAGAVLLALRRGQPLFNCFEHWRSAALVGLLLLAGGTGGVAFAEQSLSSGQAALLVACVPVWLTLWEWLRGGFPGWAVLCGLVLGTSGVAVLVAAPGTDLFSSFVVLAGTVSWAAGSVLSRKLPQPADSMQFSAMTMLWGGLWLSLMSWLREEAWSGEMNALALGSWLYLVVFGSIVGLSVYTWLLRKLSPALVGTYTYVNPLVAVALATLAGEPMPARWPQAMTLIVFGVALVSLGKLTLLGKGGREAAGALKPARAADRPSSPIDARAALRRSA